MKAKSILANASVIIICVCVFFSGYARSLNVPVYADDTTDAWTQVTTNQQLVEAFKYYCKSRDLTIEGSVADAVTNFTTKTFNGLCNTLGIDVTALQAQLKYQTDGNLGNKFLFTALGIDAYNRIFAQFLQDNDLEVGDNVNKVVESGLWWSDDNGNGCYCFITNGSSNINNNTVIGTVYKNFDASYFSILTSNSSQMYDLLYKGNTYKYYVISQDTGSAYRCSVNSTNSYTTNIYLKRFNSSEADDKGYISVNYDSYEKSYYFGYLSSTGTTFKRLYLLTNGNAANASVYITTNNTTINNNVYEGDTVINNNGTTGDDNDPDPDPDPDEPNYNPYPDGGGTVTPPGNVGGNGSDGTINFPDLNLNLPEINWSLGDLSQKFPFSIPFDMIAFLTLLNGEPQAPHITGSIPLTSHYTWELDLDFSQFDTFAGIMRGLEFVGFMFFLISATINIVRG